VPPLYDGNGHYTAFNANPVSTVARGDYGACGGDQLYAWVDRGPNSLAEALTVIRNNTWLKLENTSGTTTYSPANGICYLRSEVKLAQVTDGTSNTYMLGERYIDPLRYTDGTDGGDNESMYSGCNNDVNRTTYYNGTTPSHVPRQDTPGVSDSWYFGSAHANGCFMSFCDGSVHLIGYSINPEVHRCLGNRKDGKAIDLRGF
jgi:hypothetical protein